MVSTIPLSPVDLVPIELQIPAVSNAELCRRAMEHWRDLRRQRGLPPKPPYKPSSAVRREKVLNYCRHRCSNYEAVFGGRHPEDWGRIRERFNAAIIKFLADLEA